MALYDTRFGLRQDVVDYLNQPMPDVSGIRSVYQPSPQIVQQEPVEQVQNVGLTPEQILLLRSQLYNQGDGGENDDVTTNPNNAGITGIKGIGTALSFAINPMGTLLGLGLKKGYNNYQNPYTNIIGNLNQQTQDAIAKDIARDMQESNKENNTGGYQAGYSSDFMDGPSGDSGNSGGSPGSSGPGGSDSMGSF